MGEDFKKRIAGSKDCCEKEIFAGLGKLFVVPAGINKEGYLAGEMQELKFCESKLDVSDDGNEGFYSRQIMGSSINLEMQAENISDMEEMLNDGDGCFDIALLAYNMEAIRLHKQKIDVTPIVSKRIPRKMKKALKKRYGDKWMYHHPNADFNVEIKSMEAKK